MATYWVAFLRAAAITALVLVPGLWWNTWHPTKGKLETALLVVPGILCLATLGLLYWRLGPSPSRVFWRGGIGAITFLALDLTRYSFRTKSWQRIFGGGTDDGAVAIFVWLALFVQVFAFGVNPLPVAQEFNGGSIVPARMVASPPDHAIPYRTAVYFFHGKDGVKDSSRYFGTWSIASRGPLAPLAINALFHLFCVQPNDPPSYERNPWPLGDSGADLARSFGWVSNAMVVLGAFELMRALDVSVARRRVALAWLALSPVAFINTAFLWPKLFAGYFVLCSAASALRGKYLTAGALTALAWLSHPIGALFLPTIVVTGLLAIYIENGLNWSGFLRMARSTLKFVLSAFLCMLPWLAFCERLHYRNDFALYLFGDGRGIKPALTIGSWLATRWSNLWYTLVLGAFVLHPEFMRVWLEGPVSQPLRWTVQYAKTLPAELGFSLCIPAYIGLLLPVRAGSAKAFKYGFLVFGFLLMLIYWGFSDDGLGRNCLEPLTVGAIVLTACAVDLARRWMVVLLILLFLENRWIEFSGFLFETRFSWEVVTPDSLFAFAMSSFAALIILILGFKHVAMRRRTRDDFRIQV
ncbi:MAG: hypothetical protein JO308_06440 [Verrucomicrobia bacterium]|nr:hypothetical protein [Verrucomicrobiota bacterium]